jgi:hypothetical protein
MSRAKRELLLFLAADGIYDAARSIGKGQRRYLPCCAAAAG